MHTIVSERILSSAHVLIQYFPCNYDFHFQLFCLVKAKIDPLSASKHDIDRLLPSQLQNGRRFCNLDRKRHLEKTVI